MTFNAKSLHLYAITDRHWLHGRTLESQVREVLLGGATLVQYRDKELPDAEFLAEARRIQCVCGDFGVPLIINDRVEIARELGAGVHVGRHDMALRKAREMLGPEAIIGVSCKSVEQAREAAAAGADYLGVGAVFPTTTKSDASALEWEILRDICRSRLLPVVAIGGITLQNARELAGTGIAGIAVVSALFGARSPREAAQSLSRLQF